MQAMNMLRAAIILASISSWCFVTAACTATPRDPGLQRSAHERFDRYYLRRESPFAPRGDLFDRP